jgi:hypothetical protein
VPQGGRIGACPSLQRGKKERKCEKNERMERLISGLHIGALIKWRERPARLTLLISSRYTG